MKKRIIPLFFLVLLLATVMIPTSAAISTKAISGKPTLKIEGTTAWQSLNDMYLGYGLVQWDDGKLFIDWAKKEGVISAATAEAVNSLAYSNPKKLMDAELDYLIVSMNTVGNWFKPDNNQSKYGTSETLTASQFKVSNKSADILARIFCGHYERPGVPKISERVANAKKWYNFL